ncbi:mediator of DNA damage checkpoint protein 1 [Petaurus breviceps papuanus]|uniref:mediator of DNA damage checkpoint protein 1 n=1 Tax=Petaurus breviceps papuanus TaxID=3040969 RepID=UPI0036DC7254
MEDTQLVDWEAQEEEPEDSNGSPPPFGLEPVGRLHLFSSVRGPEKDFLLYPGKNVVGRIPGCTVALPFPSISKQHAIIEIPAQGRAPILRDCGSLNHTRLLRPPKLLSPGVGHQLRDQDLVLFADLPCQYHHLGAPPLHGPRGALSVEETPRVPGMGGPRFQGTLLAEDSEEEGDSPLDGSVKVPVPYSPSETVVPESDVEGASPGTKGPVLPLTFILDSDTDEDPPPAEPSLATRRGSTVDKEWSRTGEENHPSAVQRDSDTDVERNEGIMAVLSEAHLKENLPTDRDSDTDDDEGSLQRTLVVTPLAGIQPSSLEDSGTDLEEEGLSARPAKADLEMCQPHMGDSDTDIEEDSIPAAPPVVRLGKDQVPIGGTNNVDIKKEGAPTDLSTVHLEKDQQPVGGDGDSDTDADDNGPLTDMKKSQLPAEENSGLQWTPDGNQLERNTKKVETQGRIPITKQEQHLSPFPRVSSGMVETSTLEKTAQVILEGTQNYIEGDSEPDVEGTEDFQNKSDDTSDLDLQDTQCFVEGLNQNHRDEPWEILATQPFCSETSEASGTQSVNSYVAAHVACPSPPKTASDLQPGILEKTEPSKSQGSENPNTDIQGQTIESDMENQVIEIETPRITPERKMGKGTFKRKTLANKAKRSKRKRVSPVVQTEIPGGQRCATSRGVQNVMTEKDFKSCGETKAVERQTPEKDICERQAPERKTRSLMVEVKVPREMLEREAEGQLSEDYDQDVQNPAPVPKSKTEEGDLQELASNPQILSDSRYQRGLDGSKSLPVEEVPMGDQDSSNVPLVASKVPVPEVPAPSSTPRITRSQNRRTSKPLHSSSPASQESPVLGTARSKRQGILLAPNIEPLLPQNARHKSESSFQSQSHKPSSPSSAPAAPVAPELHSSSTPKDFPVVPETCHQTRQSRKRGTTRTCGSTTVVPVLPDHTPSIPKERSETPVPPPRALRSQRARVGDTSESLTATPEPSYSLTPEVPAPRATRSQRVGAIGMPVFTPEAQPKLPSQKRPLATKEPSPSPKQSRRGRSQRQESSKEEEDEKPVEAETTVKTPVGVAELAVQAKEEVKGTPTRSLRRARLSREPRVPKVLFTGVVDARGEQAVLALGGSLAGSVAEASHLVTDRVRRTVKFLCALGRGIPILSLEWLHQSRKAGRFLPPDEFVVNDPEQEKNFGFSLREALSRAQERGLLEGYEIYVTPGVQPPPPQMGEIITCCGGTALSSMPRAYKPQRLVISCPQDLSRCSAAVRAKLPLLSPEFLLTGVLRQEAQIEAFLLSTSDSLPS